MNFTLHRVTATRLSLRVEWYDVLTGGNTAARRAPRLDRRNVETRTR